MGFFGVVGKLVQVARQILGSRPFQLALGGASIADLLNLDQLRRETIRLVPGASAEQVKSIADFVARAIGLGPENTLWVKRRGVLVDPKYIVIRTQAGDLYLTDTLVSQKARRAFQRTGNARGFRAGQRNIAMISQAQRG